MSTRAATRPQAPLLVALLVAAGVLLFLLLPRTEQGGQARPAEGGRIREAVVGSAARVNPLDAGATPAERDLAALVFAGLTRPGPDGEPRPALAESWDAGEDARVFVFRLRNGLTWHDGEEVTADDVVFTVGAIVAMAGRADARLVEVWRGAAVARLSDSRVRVELPQPFAALPSFASFGLLPAHLLKDVPAEQLTDHAFFREPVGAGPFRLTALTAEGAELRRFPGYALGPPLLDAIELRFVSGLPEARGGLMAGEVDGALVGQVADPRSARTGADTGGVETQLLSRTAYAAVLLNHRLELFADPSVRLALSLALDRTALAERGGGVPADTPFPPGGWAADGLRAPPADPDRASLLLEAAGWSRGADGIARRDGRELAFALLVAAEGGRVPLARAVAEAWVGIGARVTVAPAGSAALVRDFLAPRAFQAALIGWDPGPDPDPFGAWHSALAGRPEGNFGDAADPQLDALAAEGRAARSYAERRATYAAFAARFREVQPGIVLFAEAFVYATRLPLTGVEAAVAVEPADRFAVVHRWHVRTRRW